MSEPSAGDHLQLERLVFFSDAVFAIAITILVLEIRLPELPANASDGEIGRALVHVVPKIAGFIFSFLVVGAYWEGHHRTFALVERIDRGLVWRNLLLLLTVSFIPFPTALFSEHPSQGLPLRFYAASLAAVGICTILVWRHATSRGGLLRAGEHGREVRRLRNRTLATPVICALSVLCSLFSLALARALLIAIPVAVAVGDRLAQRSRT
jgi:uncharacterized membrane protein